MKNVFQIFQKSIPHYNEGSLKFDASATLIRVRWMDDGLSLKSYLSHHIANSIFGCQSGCGTFKISNG